VMFALLSSEATAMSTKDQTRGHEIFWEDDDLGRLYQDVMKLRLQVRQAEDPQENKLASVPELTRSVDMSAHRHDRALERA
jgi:hypothetical protein